MAWTWAAGRVTPAPSTTYSAWMRSFHRPATRLPVVLASRALRSALLLEAAPSLRLVTGSFAVSVYCLRCAVACI